MKKAIISVLALFLLSTPQIFASGKARPIQNDQKAKEKMVLLKARDGALTKLKSQSKSKIDVRFDEKGIPTFLKGELSLPASGDKKDFALQFLDGYKELFLLKDPRAELKVKSVQEDKAGNIHIRFDQAYQGIPVWGAQLLVHLHKDGYIKSVNGRWEPTPQIDVIPTLSKENALKIAKDDLKNLDSLLEKPEVELLIFPWQNETHLAWQVTLIPDLAHDWKYFVDAKTGTILLKYNDVKDDGSVTALGVMLNGSTVSLNAYIITNTIYLIDATKSMYVPPIDSLKGIIVTLDDHNDTTGTIPPSYIIDPNSDTVFNDNNNLKAGVSAHYYVGKVYDYFYNTFGRNSWDDNGGRLINIVHFRVNYNNAFWNGSCMVFGDGDSLEFLPFAGALDITAHELGHAVTQATAGLIYLGESGALNEHLSDVWGAMVDRKNWLIGEDITLMSPGFGRDMADPHQGLPTVPNLPYAQPANMSEYVDYPSYEPYDNGGVHVNMGIPNKACYLLATAITRDTTEQLYYQALNYYLFPTSRFVDLRRYLLQAAEDLYSLSSNYNHIISSIGMAFDSVGVIDFYNYGLDILAYDDGNAYYYLYSDVNISHAVRFTPHAPCSLLAIIAQFYTTGNNSYLHIWKDSLRYGIPGTELLNLNINRTITSPDWGLIDLTGFNLHFDEDFYVGFTATSPDSFLLSDSLMDVNHYTVYYDSGSGWFCVNPPGDWTTVLGDPLIQAIVKYDSLPTDVDEDAVTLLPSTFNLYQNFPNPFNPETEIRYNLPKGTNIQLTVYNLLGQRIRTLVNEYQNAGHKSIHWDGKDEKGIEVASGIYFYLLKGGEYKQSKKMILLR